MFNSLINYKPIKKLFYQSLYYINKYHLSNSKKTKSYHYSPLNNLIDKIDYEKE